MARACGLMAPHKTDTATMRYYVYNLATGCHSINHAAGGIGYWASEASARAAASKLGARYGVRAA